MATVYRPENLFEDRNLYFKNDFVDLTNAVIQNLLKSEAGENVEDLKKWLKTRISLQKKKDTVLSKRLLSQQNIYDELKEGTSETLFQEYLAHSIDSLQYMLPEPKIPEKELIDKINSDRASMAEKDLFLLEKCYGIFKNFRDRLGMPFVDEDEPNKIAVEKGKNLFSIIRKVWGKREK